MAEANVGVITSQFPNIFEAPFSGQGDIESVERKMFLLLEKK